MHKTKIVNFKHVRSCSINFPLFFFSSLHPSQQRKSNRVFLISSLSLNAQDIYRLSPDKTRWKNICLEYLFEKISRIFTIRPELNVLKMHRSRIKRAKKRNDFDFDTSSRCLTTITPCVVSCQKTKRGGRGKKFGIFGIRVLRGIETREFFASIQPQYIISHRVVG